MDWPLVEKPSPPAPRYCGGLPLQEGYCLVPATGTFEEINFDEVLPPTLHLHSSSIREVCCSTQSFGFEIQYVDSKIDNTFSWEYAQEYIATIR